MRGEDPLRQYCQDIRRLLRALLPGKDVRGDDIGLQVHALLRLFRGRGRDGQRVRHEPDGGGVVGDAVPVIQADDFVNLPQAAAEVAGVLLHGKLIGVRRDLDGLDKLLRVARQAARHAGENEADAFCLARVQFHGLAAHHDDVRVAQLRGDLLRHVQAVPGARIAVDDVLAHGNPPDDVIIKLLYHRAGRLSRLFSARRPRPHAAAVWFFLRKSRGCHTRYCVL